MFERKIKHINCTKDRLRQYIYSSVSVTFSRFLILDNRTGRNALNFVIGAKPILCWCMRELFTHCLFDDCLQSNFGYDCESILIMCHLRE